MRSSGYKQTKDFSLGPGPTARDTWPAEYICVTVKTHLREVYSGRAGSYPTAELTKQTNVAPRRIIIGSDLGTYKNDL